MTREFTFQRTPDLVGPVTRRFIRRNASKGFVVSALLVPIAIFFLVRGRFEVLAWLGIIVPALYILVWIIYYQRALKVCRELPDPTVAIKIEPEGITFSMPDQTTTMKWSRIKTLWRFPEALLFFTFDQQTFTMIPLAELGEDGAKFIEEQVRAAGGKTE